MDRMEVMQSPAYLAMTPSGKRVLHIIEGMTSRNGGEPVALSHSYFMARKMTQASSCKAVKQLVALGFVTVEAACAVCPGPTRPSWPSARAAPPSTRCRPRVRPSAWQERALDASRPRPRRRAGRLAPRRPDHGAIACRVTAPTPTP